jgi:hypothetical protein
MLNAIAIGTFGGLIFGVIVIWEGAGAAGITLGFTALGFLIGIAVQTVQRLITGDIDATSLREVVSAIISGRRSG